MTDARSNDRLPGNRLSAFLFGRNTVANGMLALSAMSLGGCISINAPEKPIVIELNINITQEVIYRLAEDAGNTIKENSDIF